MNKSLPAPSIAIDVTALLAAAVGFPAATSTGNQSAKGDASDASCIRPEGAQQGSPGQGKASAASLAAALGNWVGRPSSIPQIAFIKFELMALEQGAQLILKRHLSVV